MQGEEDAMNPFDDDASFEEREAACKRILAELSAAAPVAANRRAPIPTPVTTGEQAGLVAQAVQAGGLSSAVGTRILTPMVGEALAKDVAETLLASVIADLAPTGAIERLYAEQLYLIHLQTLIVALKMANLAQNTLADFERISTMSERLYGEFRRHLLGLKAWQAPPRALIVSRQTNIGGQQIIHQDGRHGRANELGANDA